VAGSASEGFTTAEIGQELKAYKERIAESNLRHMEAERLSRPASFAATRAREVRRSAAASPNACGRIPKLHDPLLRLTPNEWAVAEVAAGIGCTAPSAHLGQAATSRLRSGPQPR
jgi:hypothetical protein